MNSWQLGIFVCASPLLWTLIPESSVALAVRQRDREADDVTNRGVRTEGPTRVLPRYRRINVGEINNYGTAETVSRQQNKYVKCHSTILQLLLRIATVLILYA